MIGLFGRRKDQGEFGTLVKPFAFRLNRSMVGISQRLADSQPETKTSQLGSSSLFERVKDLRQGTRFDSRAGICYFDAQSIVAIIGTENRNPTTGWREFDRVLGQVPKDLLQARAVGLEVELVGRQIESKVKMLLLNIGLANIERAPD